MALFATLNGFDPLEAISPRPANQSTGEPTNARKTKKHKTNLFFNGHYFLSGKQISTHMPSETEPIPNLLFAHFRPISARIRPTFAPYFPPPRRHRSSTLRPDAAHEAILQHHRVPIRPPQPR